MVTEEKLVREFQAIGVQPGMTLEVHSSLSSFGFVEGGADTVIRALKAAVTEEGSLFLPALRLSREMPLTERDRSLGIERKIQILPPDCAHTAMGAVADTFRRQPDTCTGEGVFRISGWGKHGGEAARGGLQFALEHGGKALLLGVDIYALTAMHYVEDLLPERIQRIFAPGPEVLALYPPENWLIEVGHPPVRAWYTIQRMAYDRGWIREGTVGSCKMRFFDLRKVVGFYAEELRRNPYRLYGMEEPSPE